MIWMIPTIEYSIPIHLAQLNKYPIGDPPDPCTYQLNIQLAIHLTHSYTKWYSVGDPPEPLHTLNEY